MNLNNLTQDLEFLKKHKDGIYEEGHMVGYPYPQYTNDVIKSIYHLQEEQDIHEEKCEICGNSEILISQRFFLCPDCYGRYNDLTKGSKYEDKLKLVNRTYIHHPITCDICHSSMHPVTTMLTSNACKNCAPTLTYVIIQMARMQLRAKSLTADLTISLIDKMNDESSANEGFPDQFTDKPTFCKLWRDSAKTFEGEIPDEYKYMFENHPCIPLSTVIKIIDLFT